MVCVISRIDYCCSCYLHRRPWNQDEQPVHVYDQETLVAVTLRICSFSKISLNWVRV